MPFDILAEVSSVDERRSRQELTFSILTGLLTPATHRSGQPLTRQQGLSRTTPLDGFSTSLEQVPLGRQGACGRLPLRCRLRSSRLHQQVFGAFCHSSELIITPLIMTRRTGMRQGSADEVALGCARSSVLELQEEAVGGVFFTIDIGELTSHYICRLIAQRNVRSALPHLHPETTKVAFFTHSELEKLSFT